MIGPLPARTLPMVLTLMWVVIAAAAWIVVAYL
jgi:hypothetical protein